ncbi:MAG: hypothetical protein QOF76_2377 [Solirubrobacteraceae bacterium]|jgi:hypothetical protein|nr:hypothetical protein [Solirubrobacteraceae bacterium]
MYTQLNEELLRVRHDEITRIRAGYPPLNPRRRRTTHATTTRGGIMRRWRLGSPAHSS